MFSSSEVARRPAVPSHAFAVSATTSSSKPAASTQSRRWRSLCHARVYSRGLPRAQRRARRRSRSVLSSVLRFTRFLWTVTQQKPATTPPQKPQHSPFNPTPPAGPASSSDPQLSRPKSPTFSFSRPHKSRRTSLHQEPYHLSSRYLSLGVISLYLPSPLVLAGN